jgi:hypothetical protein
MHIWQWEMAGSQGSTWNINPAAAANQPDNRALAQWLSGFVGNLSPGDFNDDGIVDTADYVAWRNSYGQAVTYFSGADGNGSGSVDEADYALWRSRFGSQAGATAAFGAAAPEPATLSVLLIAASALVLRHPILRRRPQANRRLGKPQSIPMLT